MRQHNVKITGSLLINNSDISVVSGSLFINGSEVSTQSLIDTGSLATTGSNTFVGNQIVTGSVGVSGSISVGGQNVVSASQLTSISSSVATTFSSSAASQLIFSSSVATTFSSSAASQLIFSSSVATTFSASAATQLIYSSSVDTTFSSSAASQLVFSSSVATTFSSSAASQLVFSSSVATTFSASAASQLVYSSSVDTRLDILELSSSLYDNVMSGSLRLYVSPDGKDTNDGSDPAVPFKTIKAAVESLGNAIASNIKRYTIFVGSGNYTENNPIAVPPGVAIVGDTLRTVRLTAQNPTKDYFHCHDSNYFYGLRFIDLKHPAFCFSYPCSTATCVISGDSIYSTNVVHSMTGYTNGNNQDLGIVIEGPDASGSIATATADVAGGIITQINIVNAGTNYTANEKPHISIPAPASKRPVIGTSPYIQNCSSITGPFQISDGAKIPVTTALPYDIGDVNPQGAGGGIRIDGNLVSGSSPLESFVADAFTQVNQGGPGHLVINKGYAQFVSCFTTFCTYGFKVANGGFANISNSVIDFGNKGLISKTYFPIAYNTGSALEAKTSTVTGFILAQSGSGYTGSVANVTISSGGATTQATAEAKVVSGSVSEIILLTTGSGYTSQPNVVIATPTGANPVSASTVSGKAQITGISDILISLESGTRGVDISSNMVLDGSDYLVTAVVTVGGQPGQRRITTFPAPPAISNGATLRFHQLSNISTGGLVMEYVGSGVTYNSLPKYGGVPIRTMEINEIAPGRVFYTTVDNIGNIKVGDFFSVNQLTGEVTIDANSFNLSGLNAIGPFKRNGNTAGVALLEVSDNINLINSEGVNGQDTAPTQYAVKGYVDPISASLDSRLDVVEATASLYIPFSTSVDSRLDVVEATASLHIPFSTSVDSRLDVVEATASLYIPFSTSVDSRLDVVEATASLHIPLSTSVNSRLGSIEVTTASLQVSTNALNSFTASYATTGSNTFKANQIISGSLTVTGNLNVFQTASFITVTSSVILGGNTIQLNTFSPAVRFGGISVIDSGSTGLTGSMLWDSQNDVWIYVNPSGSTYVSARLISGPKSNTLGSEPTLTQNILPKADDGDHLVNSQITDNGTTVTIPYTASIGSITGLGSPTAFSTSVDSRLFLLQGGEQGATTQILALGDKVNAISPYTASVIALNTYTASVSTSVGVLQSTASLFVPLSTSVNSRLVTLEGKDITVTLTGDVTGTGTITDLANVSFATTIAANSVALGTDTEGNYVATITAGSGLSSTGATTGEGIGHTLSIPTNGVTNTMLAGSIGNDKLTNSSITIAGASTALGGTISAATIGNAIGAVSSSAQITASVFGAVSGDVTIASNGVATIAANSVVLGTDTTGNYVASLVAGTNITLSNNSGENATPTIGLTSNTISGISLGSNLATLTIGTGLSGTSYNGSTGVTIANTGVTSNVSGTGVTVSGATGAVTISIGQAVGTGSDVQFNSLGVGKAASATPGRIEATQDIVAYSSSDRRFKENITPIENAIDKIVKISGNTYDWKEENKSEHGYEGNDVGVIAQEIEGVLPQLVQTRENGYKAVKYEKLVALLIEGIKEQQKQIHSLTIEIEKLKELIE